MDSYEESFFESVKTPVPFDRRISDKDALLRTKICLRFSSVVRGFLHGTNNHARLPHTTILNNAVHSVPSGTIYKVSSFQNSSVMGRSGIVYSNIYKTPKVTYTLSLEIIFEV
jgi:hypothetical protein